MDRDLLEVTIPKLEQLYRSHKYTVTEVVRWYIARIQKYNGICRAVQNLDVPGALATAAHEDAEARAGGSSYVRGPMWGIPIVVKANTASKA
jgi:amidase